MLTPEQINELEEWIALSREIASENPRAKRSLDAIETALEMAKANVWQPIETLKNASVKQKKKFDVWVRWDTGKEERMSDCYFHKKANCIMGINPVRQTPLYWIIPTPPKESE